MMYQIQDRRGGMGVYVAVMDSPDLRVCVVGAAQLCLDGGGDLRIVAVESGTIVKKFRAHQLNSGKVLGVIVTEGTHGRSEELTPETVRAMS